MSLLQFAQASMVAARSIGAIRSLLLDTHDFVYDAIAETHVAAAKRAARDAELVASGDMYATAAVTHLLGAIEAYEGALRQKRMFGLFECSREKQYRCLEGAAASALVIAMIHNVLDESRAMHHYCNETEKYFRRWMLVAEEIALSRCFDGTDETYWYNGGAEVQFGRLKETADTIEGSLRKLRGETHLRWNWIDKEIPNIPVVVKILAPPEN